MAVVIYHFGGGEQSWLPGGFLGVDVFFVLSGYLISSLLLTEYLRRGRIDLPQFWVRRVRRLLPALVAMLLFVCFWVWWATPLESFPARRSDLMWTVSYLANWHLIQNGDNYFAAYTAASPLRHTWSLAVEEQFYLFWPLVLAGLLWLGRRLARRAGGQGRGAGKGRPGFVVVATAADAGVALSAWAMASSYDPLAPSAAYYSTQGRVQELFVGVLLAVLITYRRHAAADGSETPLGRLLAAVGRRSGALGILVVIGLLLAFGWMSDGEPFYYRGGALLVSVVTVALIAVVDLRPTGPVGRAFSWRPAVWLGRISYGVYLWHWPIVLMIPVSGGASAGEKIWHQAQRLVLTVLVAALSYYFLEQPVQRDRRWLTSKPRVLIAVLASSGLVVAVALPATALPGTLAQQLSVGSDRGCSGERTDLLVVCTEPEAVDAKADPPQFALLGDSTARALAPGLDQWAKTAGTTWIQAAWKRCTPINVMAVPADLNEPDVPALTCYAQASTLIRNMLASYRPKVVLIAEYWDSTQPLMVNGVKVRPGTPAHEDALRLGYQRLVDVIAEYGAQTVFLEQPPPGASIGEQYATGRPAAHARAKVSGAGRYVDGYNAVLKAVAKSRPGQARTVSLTDVICPAGACVAVRGDTLLRTDGLHYTRKFSVQLVPVLMQRIGLEP
jgi:peptidoglycan/LPS O-acetylase OafA/YrhL